MKIHILGVAGVKTAPLAVALKRQGHTVTGSDQAKIYPPVSTLLSDNSISLNPPFDPARIDLAIVGNSYKSFHNTRDEFSQIQAAGTPFVSSTQYLVDHLIKPQSILVAGSYGKTTITSLLSFLFLHLNLDPSYMFGATAIDSYDSFRFGLSDWSIIEADENKNGLDTQPTFLYYPAKYLILTSAQWEHKDTFPTAQDNFNAYRQLIASLPVDGLLVYNPADPDLQSLITSSPCPAIPYDLSTTFDTPLIGQHNQQNIAAAYTLCRYLKLDLNRITSLITRFHGTKRRLEIVADTRNILLVDDFAQSPTRVLSALNALRYSYPNRPIHVFFEPHASFLQNPESPSEFSSVFTSVSSVVLGKLKFSTDKSSRVTAAHWSRAVGPKLRYLPLYPEIINHFITTLRSGDILIHFSSGGLDGLNTLNDLKKAILDLHP